MTEQRNGLAPNLSFSKELVFVVPLLGSGLAVIFDAGYFSSIGSQFFTLFSLSEHLVFALEYLPQGVLAALAWGWSAARTIQRSRTRHERTPRRHTPTADAGGKIAFSGLLLAAAGILWFSKMNILYSAFGSSLLIVSWAYLLVAEPAI